MKKKERARGLRLEKAGEGERERGRQRPKKEGREESLGEALEDREEWRREGVEGG